MGITSERKRMLKAAQQLIGLKHELRADAEWEARRPTIEQQIEESLETGDFAFFDVRGLLQGCPELPI